MYILSVFSFSFIEKQKDHTVIGKHENTKVQDHCVALWGKENLFFSVCVAVDVKENVTTRKLQVTTRNPRVTMRK